MQREKPPEWREKQKGSRGIRRGQRYRLVFQFPIRERILRELNELKQCLTLMLEDKQAQDMDRRRQEAEREQLQNEIAQLRQALELEKKRGFWSRLFGR